MKRKRPSLFLFSLVFLVINQVSGQALKSIFRKSPLDSMGISCYSVLCSRDGGLYVLTSNGLVHSKGGQIEGGFIAYDRSGWKKERDFTAEDGLRSICEGKDSIIFYATHDNMIFWLPTGQPAGWNIPPFYFPPLDGFKGEITKLWVDADENLFVGTRSDNFYFISNGANKSEWKFQKRITPEGELEITAGEIKPKKIEIAPQTEVYCFADHPHEKNLIWIGTNKGLFRFNKQTGKIQAVSNSPGPGNISVTEIVQEQDGEVWFSTLEKGMGYYDEKGKSWSFMPFFSGAAAKRNHSITGLSKKSANEFFVIMPDTLPAIFDKRQGNYRFIYDSVFDASSNHTTDIDVDPLGNLYLVKGGILYRARTAERADLAVDHPLDSNLLAPVIGEVSAMPDGETLANFSSGSGRVLKLKHDQNSFLVRFFINDLVDARNVHFAWKIEGYTHGWIETPQYVSDSTSWFAWIDNIRPGKYTLHVRVKIGEGNWRKQQASLSIIIVPPFWKTWWFWTISILIVIGIIAFIMHLKIKSVKRRERLKATHEKEMLELEARALRSQMNPHFIFNCLNSIKAIILQHDDVKAITYLTTFSKLIRTLFNNADKREISLYDEIETCKLYLQLEAIRFDSQFNYDVIVDESLDLKSVSIPALIIQPFIENAIWHGIVPKGSGGNVALTVNRSNGNITLTVEDNGIGREASMQSKSASSLRHQSKGVNLIQSRLQLDNLLQQRNARLDIIDKKDTDGQAAGTKVIITLPFEE